MWQCPLEGTSEFNLYSLPWFCRPCPCVEQCYGWGVLDAEAWEEALDHLFNVLVNAFPLHIVPCYNFILDIPKVTTMKFAKKQTKKTSNNKTKHLALVGIITQIPKRYLAQYHLAAC